MRLVATKSFFVDEKSKMEFVNRIKNDKTIPKELRDYLSTFINNIISFVVVSSNEPIGFVFGEIMEDCWIDGDVLFTSYYIFPPYRGNGFVLEAIKIFATTIKKVKEISTLKFVVDEGNIASRKIMRKLNCKEKVELEFYLEIE